MLLFLELNEVNFEYVNRYAAKGELPVLSSFLARHGFCETSSETRYEDLEPWIQWVTAHTGLALADHHVFRLGDIIHYDHEQIWERLARSGLRVGAISPMNAKCRSGDFAFFFPDPWTATDIVASPRHAEFFRLIAKAVNSNAAGPVSGNNRLGLVSGALATALPENWLLYARHALASFRFPWRKAIVLDHLLTDLFTRLVSQHQPDFATLFLNAGAHIQHHYMFSSQVYDGPMRNPAAYVRPGVDPLLDVYVTYDRILGQVMRSFPEARIMIATGLHQDPHPDVTFYWRLKDHDKFLNRIGVPHRSVELRMSRDFLVVCNDTGEAQDAERILKSAQDVSGKPLFEVDNRGSDLFVMLTYPRDISADMDFVVGNQTFHNLRDDVAFVAIKNGQHNGTGYFADSGRRARAGESFPLREMPGRVLEAFKLAS